MADYKTLFLELNDRLAEQDIYLTIICGGGFVLQYHNIRATQDVDAFYKQDSKIEKIIESIGQKYNMNTPTELWLNNSIANMNLKPSEDICETIYSYSNLIVKIPPLQYIIGMKLESQRERDISDAGEIIKVLHEISPFNLMQYLKKYNFTIDISLVMEAFSEAYGMEWLEGFYLEHENELKKYF
ncbi:MAG: DUF6036 family nucleotidyltransferase [Oscillospiraceae bacterium]|nr:DUF6036 family nucleotidyltransferase [Oscillospiraceae bacterium]